MLRRGAVILILTATAGCGTIAGNNFDYGPRIYGGIRYDLADIGPRSFPLGALCALLDFPFSFTLDTLMLPYTIGVACSADPHSTGVLDGFVIEAEKPDIVAVEVVPSGPLPARLKPLSGAQVTVGSLTATTDKSGYFILRHPPGEPWETLHVECLGYSPVDLYLSELKDLESRKYWQEHSLRVRLKKQ